MSIYPSFFSDYLDLELCDECGVNMGSNWTVIGDWLCDGCFDRELTEAEEDRG